MEETNTKARVQTKHMELMYAVRLGSHLAHPEPNSPGPSVVFGREEGDDDMPPPDSTRFYLLRAPYLSFQRNHLENMLSLTP